MAVLSSGARCFKADLGPSVPGTMRSPIAVLLAGPNWLMGVCQRHPGLDVSSNCSPWRHDAASCANSRIYASLSHFLAPDDHQVVFSVSVLSNNGPIVVRPALMEDQHC